MFESCENQDGQDLAGLANLGPVLDLAVALPGDSAVDSVMDSVVDSVMGPVGLLTVSPRESLADFAAVDPVGFLTAATAALAKLPSELWRTGNEVFAGIVAAMDGLAVQLDCARVGLVAEAESRGVVDQSASATAADWLLANSSHFEPGDASRTVKLAHLCALPKNQ